MPSPPTPLVLDAILSVQLALRAIRKADGYHFDVKPTSVVIDPIALETIPESALPYFIVGSAEEGPRFSERNYQAARYVKDVLTFPIVARVDAEGGSDTARKITAWARLIADIEKALIQDLSRGGIAIDTRLEPSETPSIALGNQNMVFVKQPVSVRLNPRLLGQMG